MPEFKTVLFDFDYTLADSSRGVIECTNHALCQLGFGPASDEQIRLTIGLPLSEVFCRLTFSSSHEMVDRFSKLFTEKADQVMLENIVLFESVRPAISALLAMGLKLGIVSTKYRYRIEACLKREGLDRAFATIVGGEDVAVHKPDPTGLLWAMERLGNPPSATLYVGDSVTDAQTARNAGTPFAAVLSGVTAREAFDQYEPIAVIQTLSELPQQLCA